MPILLFALGELKYFHTNYFIIDYVRESLKEKQFSAYTVARFKTKLCYNAFNRNGLDS